MRSCLLLSAIAAVLSFSPAVSTAQSDVVGATRPTRGVSRPAAPVDLEVPANPAQGLSGSGITVSLNSKLTAGDQVSLQIVEDRDPALLTAITDTGEVEVNGLGRVYVAGKTTAEAQSAIENFLKQKYYHQATVRMGIVLKAIGEKRLPKVVVGGKIGRPGPQYFSDSRPLKLTEAVIVAGTNLYSETRKVRLTRGGRTSDHNVELIMKQGRTDLDIQLQDGDQVFVPARGIVFSSN